MKSTSHAIEFRARCRVGPERRLPRLLLLAVVTALAGILLPVSGQAQDDQFSDRLEEARRVDDASARAAACQAILRDGPPPAVAAACRCVLDWQADQPDSAQQEAERFFAARAYVAPGGLLIAEELDRRGRGPQVGRFMRRLIEAAPDEPILRARWGAMCLARGDTTEAARRMEEVARRRGDFVGEARRLVRTYARWERIPDATALLYRLAPRVDSPSEYAAIQRDLGFVALGVGDTLLARVSFQEAQTWRATREVLDALAFLPTLKALPPEQAALRARARAEQALGWELSSPDQTRKRLEDLRLTRASSRVSAHWSERWRKPE